MNLKKFVYSFSNSLKILFTLSFSLFLLLACEEGLYHSIPPLEGSLTINNNQPNTYARSVQLSMDINDAYEMRFSNSDGLWSEWEQYSSSRDWVLNDGYGEKIVYAEFRRRFSTTPVRESAGIVLLNTNENFFSINNNAAKIISGSVSLQIDAFGAVEMRFSNDNTIWSEWEPYSSSKSWELEAGLGSRTVYAELLDSAGNSTDMNDSVFVVEPVDAGSSGFVINIVPGSFVSTVTFNMNVTGAVEMRFSYDGLFWTDWESYSSAKECTFVNGTGTKTVYGQFRDAAGNVVEKTDSISIPGTTGFSISINNDETYVLGPNSQLSLNGPGSAQVCFSNNNATWSSWESYGSLKSWQLDASSAGNTIVYVKFRDSWGNEVVKSDSIFVATAALITLTYIGSYRDTGSFISLNVHYYLLVVPGAKFIRLKINIGEATWSEWEGYSPNPRATPPFDRQNGSNIVCLDGFSFDYELKDAYGNVISYHIANDH